MSQQTEKKVNTVSQIIIIFDFVNVMWPWAWCEKQYLAGEITFLFNLSKENGHEWEMGHPGCHLKYFDDKL